MIKLVTPNPKLHEYVIGIDFGHGETSAAYCHLQWNKLAGQSDIDAYDIRLNPHSRDNGNIIISAVSIVEGCNPKIGKEAFSSEQLVRDATMRVCFKQPPKDINGEQEMLMIKYMKAVYSNIRDIQPDLTDTNHIVYIARPSGWQENGIKELYKEMALKAGIPLAGLTSESRAAIFYALNTPQVAFVKEIEKGAIVFDLGSSTVDFTYLAKDQKAIDEGFPLGASIIEKVIYDEKIVSNDKIQKLINNYPQYKDALLFKAREIKERIYQQNDSNYISETISLRSILPANCQDFEPYNKEKIYIEYDNVTELNQILEEKCHYLTSLKDAMLSFRNNNIESKKIYGVFLTGGASRMSFVADLIRETYNLDTKQVRIDPTNPSLTISRGIAMLGRADCVSDVLVKELQDKVKGIKTTDVYKKFVSHLAENIGKEAWAKVALELSMFKMSSTKLSVDDLEKNIRTTLSKYASVSMKGTFYSSLRYVILDKSEEIRKELNQIISYYSPGAELKPIDTQYISLNVYSAERQLDKLTDIIVDKLTEQITNNLGQIIMEVLEVILYLVLFGIFYPIYKGGQFLYNRIFRTEAERKKLEREEKEKQKKEIRSKKLSAGDREKCYKEIMKDSEKIKEDIIRILQTSLLCNQTLQEEIEPIIIKRTQEFISKNIESVRIPIE